MEGEGGVRDKVDWGRSLYFYKDFPTDIVLADTKTRRHVPTFCTWYSRTRGVNSSTTLNVSGAGYFRPFYLQSEFTSAQECEVFKPNT